MPLPISELACFDAPSLFQKLKSRETGLTDTEAKTRLVIDGPNVVTSNRQRSAWLEFLNNFTDPMIVVLLLVAVISFVTGNLVDGTVVLVMVAMSVILNFIQEYKASKAAETLQAKVAHMATVIRHGKTHELLVENLVRGDIIELNAGDLIPADARLIEAKDLYVNQSALTGESFPVEKESSLQAKSPRDLTGYINTVFSGTAVVTGWGLAVVVATGAHTQLGSLAKSLTEERADDEFSQSLHGFSRMMVKLITIMVVLIFGVRAVLSQDALTSLQFAVAVAVGLTPEFLPMIMSVTMAGGSVQMAKKGVIVKKLTAIPTLGSMDILCTDKTGTLTENKIKVVKYINLHNRESLPTLHYAYVNSYFQSGITNPMDEAVRSYGHATHREYEKVDEIPFDFERKKLSIVVADNKQTTLITKGAPEAVLACVSTYQKGEDRMPMTAKEKRRFREIYNQLSAEGFRVLAVATKTVNKEQKVFSKVDEKNLCFSGFIAFLDPAKKGVRNALDEIEALGIEVKVITGDNELVTQKICTDVDIPVTGMLLGHEIEEMSDDELAEAAAKTTVFARFDPHQKNRVIHALRAKGHVVGYMGDGINDAPSLMSADVGISVANAVDVAREAADFVLTHKSLYELAAGVYEGRKTFGNTIKYIQMGISSNFGNMFSMLGAVILLPFLPMLPMQILLNNFLYDFTQIAIPTDHVDEEYLQSPKRLRLPVIKKFMVIFGPISSLFDFITFGFLYLFFANSPGQFQTGWFVLSLSTQTLVIHIIRTRRKPFIESRASWPLMVTTFGGLLLGWSLPYLPIAHVFHFETLPLPVSAGLAMIAGSYLLVVEQAKQWYYRK